VPSFPLLFLAGVPSFSVWLFGIASTDRAGFRVEAKEKRGAAAEWA